jgi:hypothetical protein
VDRQSDIARDTTLYVLLGFLLTCPADGVFAHWCGGSDRDEEDGVTGQCRSRVQIVVVEEM